MNNKYPLSKSGFMQGLQCLKAAYFKYNYPELKTPPTYSQQSIINQGLEVGRLARQLYSEGVDLSGAINESIIKTQYALNSKHKVFFEAAFSSSAQNIICQSDIFILEKRHTEIIEVKSSTEVSSEHVWDIAYQYYVIKASGYQLPLKAFILHINNKYVRDEKLNLKKLFNKVDVTDQVMDLQKAVAEYIAKLQATINQDEQPSIPISESCFKPYQCSFYAQCWSTIPKKSVFNIGGLRKRKAFELFNNGLVEIKDVPDYFSLSPKQRIEVDTEKNGEPYINYEEIAKFLKFIDGPTIWLDFETFLSPIPPFKNTRPYQQIPFQFSTLITDKSDKIIEQIDFLATPGTDPRREFVRQLVNLAWQDEKIIVYNQAFEISIIKQLADHFPEYYAPLQDIIDRIEDLMIPFSNRWFYSPKQKGSHSIKAVLPVLVENLSYSDLNIKSGDVAMAKYKDLENKSQVLIEQTKQDLIRYCQTDVLAMLKLKQALNQIILNENKDENKTKNK